MRRFATALNLMRDELSAALATRSTQVHDGQALPSRSPTTASMNISVTDDLMQLVAEQVAAQSCTSTSECLRDLIRRQCDTRPLRQLRQMLLDRLSPGPAELADAAFFAELPALATVGEAT